MDAALEKALVKVSELEATAADYTTWTFDKKLDGQRITKPTYVGGLAVSPSGWLLQFGVEQ